MNTIPTNLSYQNKKEFRAVVTQAYLQLVQLKNEGNLALFHALIMKIIPKIKSYVNRRLHIAMKKGGFSKGKYKPADIINPLFIELYDNIEKVENEQQFYLWLYKKTNELIDELIIEEQLEYLFLKNIDEFAQAEWDEMEENFSTDGDGDLLMIEELDDISYHQNDYNFHHLFQEDNEKALMDKIDKSISHEKIEHHIKLVLYHLPPDMRQVFELFTNEHLKLQEIAQIRNCTLEEVQHLLEAARKFLKLSLFNRYTSA
ncbi:sigma-70 family RNA polymerase sigma factor [Nonlabens sp.]|uniref:RNA polymerase sigma factor n=1 Tax=Nonlabens sp. TaxID=1888209 RepID=UPI001BCD21F6|nr:sigma-70 family RNA polymerase sigma factor [Nonlabens sp.]